MKEELEEIVKTVMKFCNKYGKDYIDVCFINNNGMATLKYEDKDYEDLKIYIQGKEIL